MKQKLLNSIRLRAMMLVAVMCTAFAGQAWATDYSYTFTAKVYEAAGAQTLGTVSWTMAGTGGTYFGYDGTKGQQFGSGGSPYSAVSLSTSGISGTITSVVVNTSGAKSIDATVAVTVGSTSFLCSSKSTATLTNTATDYTFTGSASGDIVISYANSSSKAIYVKSITVTYTGGGGGSTVVAPTFSPVAGAVAAGTNVELSSETTGAAIYYTLTTDGSEPAAPSSSSTEYSDPISITTATKIKAIAIKGDDESSVTSASYTISVAAPEYNLASSGNYMAGTDLTLTSTGNTIYYNKTTDGSTPSNPTSSSTKYTDPISLSSGTVKIKAIAYDNYGNASSVASLTVNGIAPTTLPFKWDGGARATFTAKDGVAGYSLGDYADNDSNRPYLIKLDGNGDYIEIFTTAQPLKVSVGTKMIGGGSTSKITVQESTNGVEFSDVEDLSISGSSGDVVNLVTTKNFASTTRVIKLLFTKGSNVGVGPISIAGGSLPATLNASGYATFASSFALDFSDDSEYSAWQIASANTSTGVLTFSQITGTVAAGTGVLLKGTASASINIPVAASGSDISGTNKLVGITAATAVASDTYYGLSGNTFKKVNAGTVPAGKALLPADEVAGVKAFTFVFEDETTGISTVANGQEPMANCQIFNLAGQRMSKLQKGVNIVNGKKVLVK